MEDPKRKAAHGDGHLTVSVGLVFLALVSANTGADEGVSFMPARSTSLSYSGWITPEADPTTLQQHRLTLQVPVLRDEQDALSSRLRHTRSPWERRFYFPGQALRSDSALEARVGRAVLSNA